MARCPRLRAAVFIGLLFWGWLWGVWGLLLGLPITGALGFGAGLQRVLTGDSAVRSIQSQLRTIIGGTVAGDAHRQQRRAQGRRQ